MTKKLSDTALDDYLARGGTLFALEQYMKYVHYKTAIAVPTEGAHVRMIGPFKIKGIEAQGIYCLAIDNDLTFRFFNNEEEMEAMKMLRGYIK